MRPAPAAATALLSARRTRPRPFALPCRCPPARCDPPQRRCPPAAAHHNAVARPQRTVTAPLPARCSNPPGASCCRSPAVHPLSRRAFPAPCRALRPLRTLRRSPALPAPAPACILLQAAIARVRHMLAYTCSARMLATSTHTSASRPAPSPQPKQPAIVVARAAHARAHRCAPPRPRACGCACGERGGTCLRRRQYRSCDLFDFNG